MMPAATDKAAPSARYPKELLHQVARAALVGITVYATLDDRAQPEFIATRWAMTRAFSSIDELRGWLDRCGAPA
jgi:hypothetical protein